MEKENEIFKEVSWKLIDKYIRDNPQYLVDHHLESYNSFFSKGIVSIFNENNPIRFIEREDKDDPDALRNECLVYLGGKDGSKLFFGKPIIYDDMTDKKAHYMYPNDSRLRNMTYGITIHYEVYSESIYYINGEKQIAIKTDKAFLGRFPIMLQSNLCILKGLTPEARFNMGECRNDYGGYFIIDGKEKSIIPQEKFADNMLYVKKYKEDTNIYSFSADIRSVSEDASKPVRSTSVKILAPSTVLSNSQILVMVPNVRKPVPLFILMRALGIVSDKSIIEHCLLDLDKNNSYVDLFIPSVHDANKIFTQQTALEYIALFTKFGTITYVYDILMNYFLPHIGGDNFLDKAYFIGYMVYRMLKVYRKDEKPTDRDNFRFKRIELPGSLLYDLFREYYLIQNRDIALKIDREHYYHKDMYKNESFPHLIELNFTDFFKDRLIETGFKKAFKGNWGATAKTKQIGVVQDLNRLSWNTFISQLRKLNLPLDASAKVVGPRQLNSSQWGYIDPVDTPDGGNIGLHKHLAVSTQITSGFSSGPIINWLRANTPIRILQECDSQLLNALTKIFVNGNWIACIENPIEFVNSLKLYRRNGLLPVHLSIAFFYEANEILLYTDAGRLTRPIYYLLDKDDKKKRKDLEVKKIKNVSFDRNDVLSVIKSGKFTWQEIISGFTGEKDPTFNYKNNTIYTFDKLYPTLKSNELIIAEMEKNKSVVDYVDVSEEEGLMIAGNNSQIKDNKYYTHVEIEPSLMFGVMGNQVIFPENNPVTRNAFSCGQSKQAVSLYHSNHQMRIDKMGVILNYGQVPLIKSRYLEYFNKEEQPNGVNTIVAIMSYTGYNVEDAILINEGSIKRGLFNTTYYSMYEGREDSSKVGDSTTNTVFADVMKKDVSRIKPGYDYSFLDEHGLVIENTPLNDKIVVIGKVSNNSSSKEITDMSIFPKKGQLGYVDKSFITEGEEGFRIAKIKVREERIPAMGDKMACALPTQQVLTNIGWIEIKDIDINIHKVATLDINGNMCYEYPVNKFEYDHNGKMYYVKNKQVEVVCTLNHKLYIKRREHNGIKKQYELIEAEKVMGKMVRFQKSMKNVYPDVEYITFDNIQYKMDDWLQFLGMFIADGCTNIGAIYISALKQRKIDFNTNILTNLGLKYKYDDIQDKFIILKDPYQKIYNHLDNLSVGALNKYLPDYIWNISQRQSIILLDALMKGDGHTYDDGFSRYGTISLKLANDVCRLAVHCGWSGIIKIAAEPGDCPHLIRGSGKNKNKLHHIETRNTYYKISIIRKQNEPYINKKVNDSNEEKLIYYDGKVYCIEMPSSHLYYMRENNFAPSMLLGNSRCGQKGTIGLVIPESDMPFNASGIRPDLIINPHAFPSRLTIGQLMESVLGKVCLTYGGFGNCTAFETNGPNTEIYGEALVNANLHSSGNEVMYNGMTGEQLTSDIFMGPTHYMRLKHMTKDKINYRARGPNTMLTRQPVGGRANDGGLAIGSMERDGVIAHGAMGFLTESFMERADGYHMAVCNKSGCIAIYNEALNLFLSPFVDGPIKYKGSIDGTLNIDNISRFGRSFSIVKIPYTLKLLIQELQVMNIQMRIITESNIDQLVSMSYSDNINKLLGGEGDADLDSLFKKFKDNLIKTIALENDKKVGKIVNKKTETLLATSDDKTLSPEYAPYSPAYATDTSSQYDPNSPRYDPNSPQFNPSSPDEPPPPRFQASSPDEPPPPRFQASSPDGPPPPRFQASSPDEPPPSRLETNQLSQDLIPSIKNPKLKSQFEELNERDKKLLLQMMEKNKQKKNEKISEIMKKDKMDILELDENKLKLEEIVDNPEEDSTSISTIEPLSSSSTKTDETKSVKFTV